MAQGRVGEGSKQTEVREESAAPALENARQTTHPVWLAVATARLRPRYVRQVLDRMIIRWLRLV